MRGEAASEAQKELTTEYARDVDGVKSVKNEMTVATTPAKPDETMGEKIDDAFDHRPGQDRRCCPTIPPVCLIPRSTTTDGVVTVGGTAKNDAEKALVTKLVTDINGVKSVVNNMTIEAVVSSNN